MVVFDGVRQVLQQDGLAGAGRRYDQRALTLTDGAQHVHDARRQVAVVVLELEALVRMQRHQVVVKGGALEVVRRLEVDRLNFDHGEVALAVLGWADLTDDRVASAQVELADLRRGHVDVVVARQVALRGAAQEAEAVGQHFENALGHNAAVALDLGLKNLVD